MESLSIELDTTKEHVETLTALTKDGFCQKNLVSDEWHAKHAYAAHHLLHSVFSWDEYKVFWTEGILPGLKVNGGEGPITEFETIMMARIRAYRGYDLQTPGYIYGICRQRVGEYVDEKMPLLGRTGLFLSILDLDTAHDCV